MASNITVLMWYCLEWLYYLNSVQKRFAWRLRGPGGPLRGAGHQIGSLSLENDPSVMGLLTISSELLE